MKRQTGTVAFTRRRLIESELTLIKRDKKGIRKRQKYLQIFRPAGAIFSPFFR